MPFGWSFLSIARVPMIWGPGDIWTAEVELPAGTRIEYKYVILEEQDWTKQENLDSEGVATFTYRTEPDTPPDYQTIQKKMAIVAWQPGPNRMVQVPMEEELHSLQPGEVRSRTVPGSGFRPSSSGSSSSTDSFSSGSSSSKERSSSSDSRAPLWPWSWSSGNVPTSGKPSDVHGNEWEVLSRDAEGVPLLERRDQWLAGRETTPKRMRRPPSPDFQPPL